MFVTAFYDIYNKPEKLMFYFYQFFDLAVSGLPFIVFTDPSLVDKFRIFPKNVTVVPMPLTDFELYNIGTAYSGQLPSQRNEEKDTKEFLVLINTKVEIVKKAAELCDDETLYWIDFGILKVVKNKEKFILKLKEINNTKFNKITIPGCWGYGVPFTCEAVNWRFCGGFAAFPRNLLDIFFNHSKNVLTSFCSSPQYKLTWEGNVWYCIEFSAAKHIIQWYFADHDDSMIDNCPLINQ
jgi:hypothetical protein